MTAQVAAGAPAAALAAYEQLRQTLADELGTDPAPETQALYLAVLRGTPAPPAPDIGAPQGAPAPRPPVSGAPTGRVAHPQVQSAGLSTIPPRGGSAGLSTIPPRGADARWPSAPADGGFVGRERELGDLAAAWAGAVGGGRGWC